LNSISAGSCFGVRAGLERMQRREEIQSRGGRNAFVIRPRGNVAPFVSLPQPATAIDRVKYIVWSLFYSS